MFYLLLLLGSIAFGLEALLLGLGGRLSVLYRRNRIRLIGLALPIGLAIVGVPLAITVAFDLEPLYLCASVLVCMLVAGKLVNLFEAKLVKPAPLPQPLSTSDEEIKKMLQKRGLDELVKKKRK